MAAAISTKPPTEFLDLPYELRLKIYHLVLDNTPIQVHIGERVDGSTAPLPRRSLNTPKSRAYNRSRATIVRETAYPPLTAVNRQLRAETAALVRDPSTRDFVFPSTRTLLDVVTAQPAGRQQRIKHARVTDHRALVFNSYAGARGETHVVAPTVFTLADALALCEHMDLTTLLVENAFNLAAPRHEHWAERMLFDTLLESANMVRRLTCVSKSALRMRYVQPLARRLAAWAHRPALAGRRMRVLIRPAEWRAETCFSAARDRHVSPAAMAAELAADGIDMAWLGVLGRGAARAWRARFGLAYTPRAVVTVVNGDRDGAGVAGGEASLDVPLRSLPVPADWRWGEARESEFTIVHDCADFGHAYRNFLALPAAAEGEESDESSYSEDDGDGDGDDDGDWDQAGDHPVESVNG